MQVVIDIVIETQTARFMIKINGNALASLDYHKN